MPPSIIPKQLFWAEPPPTGFSTNFVPDYLDQWALKDPGKDKHSVLGGGEVEDGGLLSNRAEIPP